MMNIFDPIKPFYKGNLHAHTTQSDGHLSPEEVISTYLNHGYDFLALTDHWQRTVEEPHFEKNMLVLPGIEVDYFLPAEVIHIVGINPDISILTATTKANGPQHGISAIRRAGGRAILAHPAWSLNTLQTIAGLHDLTAVEIYNSFSAAPWNGDRADSTAILDVSAAHGCLLNTVASDDSHFYTGEECTSYTMLQADALTPQGILEALDRGAFYATRGPRFEQIEMTEDEIRVTCSPVSRILFHSDLFYSPHRCVDGNGLTGAVYPLDRVKRPEHFVRVMLEDECGRRAWANPIRIK